MCLVTIDNRVTISSCTDRTHCCDGNISACCTNNEGFKWENSTFIEPQTNREATSLVVETTTAIKTTTTTIYLPANATSQPNEATTSSASVLDNADCKSQSVTLGAGLGMSLGLAVTVALFLAWRLLGSRSSTRPRPKDRYDHHWIPQTHKIPAKERLEMYRTELIGSEVATGSAESKGLEVVR